MRQSLETGSAGRHQGLREPLLNGERGQERSGWLAFCCGGSSRCFPFVRNCCWRLSQYLHLRPRSGRVLPGCGGGANAAAASATVRVEPKTFFANERTLLQWLNIAVLLASVAITLLSFGQPAAKAAGLLLAPVAIFFIGYSFWVSSCWCHNGKSSVKEVQM